MDLDNYNYNVELKSEWERPYHFIRDTYYGMGGYRPDWEYSYLNKFPRELPILYTDRKYNSLLENIFAPLQDLFLEPIWSLKTEINTNNEKLNELLKQTKLLQYVDQALLDFKLYGKCFFSICTEAIEGVVQTDMLPQLKNIFVGDIDNLKMDGIEISYAKYIEYETLDKCRVPVEVIYENNTFTKRTLAWRINKTLTLSKQSEENRVKDFDGEFFGVFSKVGLDLSIVPKSFQFAQIQKLLFNLDSQRLHILRNSGFPVMYLQTNADLTQLSLSVDTILRIPSDTDTMKNALPGLLEPDLNGVEITGDIINEKKNTVYKVYTNGLFSDNIKYTSTMSSLIATRSFTNSVETFYAVYEEIINTMLESLTFTYNINTTYNVQIPELNVSEETLSTNIDNTLNDVE